jgi:hypothetical protein
MLPVAAALSCRPPGLIELGYTFRQLAPVEGRMAHGLQDTGAQEFRDVL